jgi:hypothetical protein
MAAWRGRGAPNARKDHARGLHCHGADGLSGVGDVFVRHNTKNVKGVSDVRLVRGLMSTAFVGAVAWAVAASWENPTVSSKPISPPASSQTPKAEPVATTPPKYNCHFVLTDISSWHQMWGNAVDEMHDAFVNERLHPRNLYKSGWTVKLDYTEKQLITKGEEYLARPECTEEADKVREIVKHMHDAQDHWPREWDR